MQRSTVYGTMAVLVIVVLVVGGLLFARQEDNTTENQSTTGEETVNEPTASEVRTLPNFTPVDDVSELQIIDLQEGTGAVVPAGATVSAHYTGALANNGEIFQSSRDFGDEPISFSLEGVIVGWSEGVPGMKVGGIRRLLIPAAMAYGPSPPPNSGIPADADLVFDIEVVAVE